MYNEPAQEPTFGGTLVRGTDYEVSYAGKAGSTDGLDFSGKPVDAGTYIVTVTGKGAYEGSFTKEFVINKAEQTNVPVGLIANSISCREGSGTIDGVTIAMEYRKVGARPHLGRRRKLVLPPLQILRLGILNKSA